MESLFAATCKMPRFDSLDTSIKTDVLVIGGGIAGILVAHQLSLAGVDTVLLEQNRLCSGVTQNTTAKITAQHRLCYAKLLSSKGLEAAQLYYRANMEALEAYCRLAKTVECDFQKSNSYVYSVTDRRSLEQELEALERIGANAYFAQELPLPFLTRGAVCLPDQAQLHPLRFLAEIARSLRIFEQTGVKAIEKHRAICESGAEIRAEQIVVATHFPFLNRHGGYPLKMYQSRSYTLALDGAPDFEGMYVDAEREGFSFRHYKKHLLIGGAGHRTGFEGGGYKRLEELAEHSYPDANAVYRWAAQDCMTLDDLPYIGRYARSTSGLLVATGFGKWGMTSAMVAARLLTDLVLGRDNPYAALFSPSRSMLKPGLAVNLWVTLSHYLCPRAPRCSHLGCALSWNPHEHSWDCPCHGSRFSQEGELLDNPATKGLCDPPGPTKEK